MIKQAVCSYIFIPNCFHRLKSQMTCAFFGLSNVGVSRSVHPSPLPERLKLGFRSWDCLDDLDSTSSFSFAQITAVIFFSRTDLLLGVSKIHHRTEYKPLHWIQDTEFHRKRIKQHLPSDCLGLTATNPFQREDKKEAASQIATHFKLFALWPVGGCWML